MNFEGPRISLDLVGGGVVTFDPADALVARQIDGRTHLYVSGSPQFFVVQGSLKDVAGRVDTLWFESDDVFFNPRWISATVARPDGVAQLFFPGLSFTVVLAGLGDRFEEAIARAAEQRRAMGKAV